MKHTDDNIQEKPVFMIENVDNDTPSQETLEEPVITIEHDDDMEQNMLPMNSILKWISYLRILAIQICIWELLKEIFVLKVFLMN